MSFATSFRSLQLTPCLEEENETKAKKVGTNAIRALPLLIMSMARTVIELVET